MVHIRVDSAATASTALAELPAAFVEALIRGFHTAQTGSFIIVIVVVRVCVRRVDLGDFHKNLL